MRYDSYKKHGKRVSIDVVAGTNIVKTVNELDYRDVKKYHIKWEPMAKYAKNDPHVLKYQKKSKPKTILPIITYKSARDDSILKKTRRTRR